MVCLETLFFCGSDNGVDRIQSKTLERKTCFLSKVSDFKGIDLSLSLSLSTYIYALQGASPYPTKREVRKIIDSKVPCRINRGYVTVLLGEFFLTSRVVDVESLDLRLVQLRTLGTDAWRMANFQVPFFSWDL